jgi:hypothetical protein
LISSALAQGPEEVATVRDKQVGRVAGGEVAAVAVAVPADDVGVVAIGELASGSGLVVADGTLRI